MSINLHDDITPPAPISAIRTTSWHTAFPPEGSAAAPARAGTYLYCGGIHEHDQITVRSVMGSEMPAESESDPSDRPVLDAGDQRVVEQKLEEFTGMYLFEAKAFFDEIARR